MTTAVDTNILLALLIPGAVHAAYAVKALTEAAASGALIVSEAVYAELAAHFPAHAEMEQFCAETRLRLERCAGEPIRARQHIVADFLIGAHAQVHADALLTLDPRFYRSYFPELRLR
jgi:predicted nucleic acid-binding protein